MKERDDELKQSLNKLPEIPLSESLYWDILEAAHERQRTAPHDVTSTRSRRRFKPFAASIAGAAVAALVIVGVLQSGVTHGKARSTTASSAAQIDLKPADVSIVGGVSYRITANGSPTVYAKVRNDANHPINKYDTFAVLWLGGTSSDPLSGESLVIANGPGTSLQGQPATDDNGALGSHTTTEWQYNLDYAGTAGYVKHGVHLRFFQAGASDSKMTPPFMSWNEAPLHIIYKGKQLMAKYSATEVSMKYNYQITNTSRRTVDLSKVWGIDWFDNPGNSNQTWDDPGVTRYADIPHWTGSSSLIRPGETRMIYFQWTIPSSIHGIVNEQPKAFFVMRNPTS